MNTSGKVVWGSTAQSPDHAPLMGWTKAEIESSCAGISEEVEKSIAGVAEVEARPDE